MENTVFGYSEAIVPEVMDLSIFVPNFERGEIDSALLTEVLEEAHNKRQYMAQQWAWFIGNGDPILRREYKIDGVVQEGKINNRINHDFVGRIVNTKTGYLFGTDATYTLDKSRYANGIGARAVNAVSGKDIFSNKKYISDGVILNDFIVSESFRDQQVEIGKYAITCGQAGRLLWHDDKNQVHSYVVKPWECLFITDGEVYDAEYAIRTYSVIKNWSTDTIETFVEVYTPAERITYKTEQYQVGSTYGVFSEVDRMPHGFGFNPLIGYANNREIQGECEKVLNKILDYSRAVSDLSSELEQTRLAYMVFENAKIDKKTLQEMRQTGAINVQSSGRDGGSRVYFLTKEIDADAVNAHLERERDDINADAGTVDFTNPKLYTNLSSVAMKMRTMQLENKSKITESKFKASNRKMWKNITDFWKKTGFADIDYLAIYETWTRNLPYNKLEEAQVIQTLKGNISDETAFGQSVFIDDPDKEMLRMESEGLDLLGDERNADR